MFVSLLLAAACIPFSAGGLSAHPREGDIFWLPESERPGIQSTYVQGPWAVQWQGSVYLGGHAGYFGPPWERNGGERPWVIQYGPDRVTATDNVLALPEDTHEMGWGTMVRVNGWWLYSGFRTTWTSWITMQRTGIGDRARGMLAVTPDPLQAPYPWEWWDVIPPYDLACFERNTCGNRDTIGPFMPTLVVLNDAVILFEHDPAGTAIWQVAIHEAGPYKAPAFQRLAIVPDFPWSDIALGDDGRFYALVSGGGDTGCWWSNCWSVDEWVSEDGLAWVKGERSWFLAPKPGGLVPYIGDGCYVRDELGHVDRDALVVIALVTPNPDPASGNWHFHYWADAGAELPATFGMPPGSRRIHRHLKVR